MPVSGIRLKTMRLGLGLTVGEAAALVQVSKRTWESWESGARNMPDRVLSTLELRLKYPSAQLKAEGTVTPNQNLGSSLVVLTSTATGLQVPVDVVARDNFLEIQPHGEDAYRVSSLAVDANGRPQVHRMTIEAEANAISIGILKDWAADAARSEQQGLSV